MIKDETISSQEFKMEHDSGEEQAFIANKYFRIFKGYFFALM